MQSAKSGVSRPLGLPSVGASMPQASYQTLSRPDRDITPLLRVGLRTTGSKQESSKRVNSFDICSVGLLRDEQDWYGDS